MISTQPRTHTPEQNSDASFESIGVPADLRAVLAERGVATPTPIQAAAIAPLLAGKDIIGQARTGSGKTIAFLAPLVARIDPRLNDVQAMVLAPTRELAIQIGDVLRPMAEVRNIRWTLLYGGRSLVPEMAALRNRPSIIIATPGRTLDHLRQGTLRLDAIRVFVLDEADEMLDKGMGIDVERIMAQTPRTRQTALFSATVPAWVHTTAARHMRNPEHVRVDPAGFAIPEIAHIVYDVATEAKLPALRTLIDHRPPGSMIVFGRTKHGVKKLAKHLAGLGYPAAALQGNMSQNARERVMRDVRSGAVPILLATNVAARGIDLDDVAQIINYELPESADLFTHRSGRTGRMGRSGEAITLLSPEEHAKWREMERALGRKLRRLPWPSAFVPKHEKRPMPTEPFVPPSAFVEEADQPRSRARVRPGAPLGPTRNGERRPTPGPRADGSRRSPRPAQLGARPPSSPSNGIASAAGAVVRSVLPNERLARVHGAGGQTRPWESRGERSGR